MRSLFAGLRWAVSFALALFYIHSIDLPQMPLNPALQDWLNPVFDFQATAYCVQGITKSGLPARPGLVAADPNVLPLGSIIEVCSDGSRQVYQVADTGPSVRGKRIDIFMEGYQRALEFGRKRVKVTVFQYGGE